jgi:chitinase
MSKLKLLFFPIFFLIASQIFAQQKQLEVIAYYAGPAERVDSFPIEKLSEIIFCFAHLKGNELYINPRDTPTLQKLVSLKSRNPQLRVVVSLGGWGGCETCSDIFSTKQDRKAFAESVKKITDHFGADGIDLDWEYPAIEGYPSHKYKPEDKQNFTKLVKQLRQTLGKKAEVSFAAGGFTQYIDSSIEWKKVMKIVNRVNLMSYDLVNGYATTTGHHTALYSTPHQQESTDNGVTRMIALGVPANKIVIGAAFYARVWENVPDSAFGLYQPGKFKRGISYKNFGKELSPENGFVYHWDSIAKAPFMYNPEEKLFATFDDKKSIELKTKYAIDKGLNGIMFWQLGEDKFTDGLLDEIDKAKKANYSAR